LSTANAKRIRSFNFDPFSRVNNQFTAMWAMTDDGLYRCTGLPNSASWTRKLDYEAAATILGKSSASIALCYCMTPNVKINKFIAVVARETISGAEWRYYWMWSLDNGGTWNCNTAYYVWSNEDVLDLKMTCSPVVSGRYYLHGRLEWKGDQGGDYAWNMKPAIMYANTLPQFSPGVVIAEGGAGAEIVWPYYNTAGAVCSDDNRWYAYNVPWLTGVDAIRKYTTAPTTYTSNPAHTDIGTADMNGNPYHSNYPLHIHPLNENRMVTFGRVGALLNRRDIWTSTNAGASWTLYDPVTIGGRYHYFWDIYLVPGNQSVIYAVGPIYSGSGFIVVGKSTNYGAAWTDISNYGTANALDTVLGLGAGDADESLIIVDYFYR
jgi:hypothetical protein